MKLKEIGGMKPVIAGLVIGAVLITAGIFTSDNESEILSEVTSGECGKSNTQRLEERLTALIEAMEGTGKVSVMIFAEDDGSAEYAEDISGSSVKNVVLGSGSDEKLCEQRHTAPDISGVAVVCPGTSESVRTSIAMLIRSLFGISAGKIYVCG